MKLHLPKLLRNSVLACITAVAGFATTTVGTATFTGGVVAFALSSQQAQADYVWAGGSGQMDGDDWKNASSWNMVDGSTWNPSNKESINGPGTTGSDMWDKIVIDGGDEGVVFGSEDSRDIPLEGWAPKYELNNAKLYANMVKLQPGNNNAIFTVRNNSLLDFQMDGGSFQGTSIVTVGENSGIIFRMQQAASTAAMNITMESSTGYVKFLAGSNINHTGAITLNPVLGELNSNWGTVDLGITAQNVTLSNLTVNLGTTFDGWTKIDTQITEANYAGFGNCYSIVKNAEGKYILTYAVLQEGNSCIWNGGDLSWANNTEFTNKIFSADSVVQFSQNDADVVLQENISAAAVIIDEGVTVTLDGNAHELTVPGALRLEGTLVLKSDCLTAASTAAGENAKVVLDAGAEKQWQVGDLPQTETNKAQYDITLASGSLYLTSSGQTVGDVVVEAGAGLRIGGSSTIGHVTLNGDGGWISDGAEVKAALLKNSGAAISLNNGVTLATDSTVQVDNNTLAITGEVSGATLTKTGEGTLRLDGNITNTGIVIDAGTVRWGGGTSDGGGNSLNCGSIVINSGGTFQINHQSASCGNTTVELNGGLLYSEDSSTDAGTSFQALKISADSQIKYHWNGGLSFGLLTGEGDIAIVGRNDNGGTSFGSVKDYHGTITSELTRSLTIGAVDQAAGKEMTIATAVTLKDFAKTGEGSLVVTGAATLQGNLAVNYEGTLTLSGDISVAADSVLSYTGNNEKVMTLGALNTNVSIDILAVSDSMLASGVNLGITLEGEDDADIEALKSKLTVIGLEDYTLTSKDGLAWLSSSSPIQLEWDRNWGAAGLAGAPSALEATEITSTIALSGNEAYDKEGYVAINATTGGDNVVIYGGASNGEGGAGLVSSDDVWIKATSGKFLGLVGASRAQNWMNGNGGWRLNADTHIEVRGADTEVGHIIGGYHQECNNPVFNGNSYISVFEGKVTGNIVGSSATVDGDNYTSYHTGNTNVFIYVPLGADTTAPDMSNAADPKHVVVGGGISLVHGQTGRVARFEMTGDTNVTIDLTGYSGDATTFDKAVYGGNYTNRTNTGCISKIVGNTNVTIKGEDITFTGDIVGGSLIQRGDATISGTASTTITGGTFSGNVVAGSYAADGSAGGDTAQVGSTKLTISGGTFNGMVYGGTYAHSGGVSVDVDSIDVNISGGTVTSLVGGNMIGGTGEAALNASLGNVDITISGGEVGSLIGGSIVWRNSADAVVNQGNITISLEDGTVGDVYAAGSQQGSSTISTASTKVVLGGGVTINAGTTISGGYTAAEGMSGSVVTGKSTLVFSGNGTMDRSALNFVDFNTVEVTTAGAKATIGTLTTTSAVEKTGAGTLTLAGGTYALNNGLTVAEGTLASQGENTLGGALTLSNGTGLDLTAGTLAVNGELTLGTGLVLTTGTLIDGDNTLLTGITSSAITEAVAASTIFSTINGLHNFAEYTVRVENGNLVLKTFEARNVVWDEANSVWANNAKFGSSDTDVFKNKYTATFGTLTADTEQVTIDGPLTAQKIHITAGEGKEYSFVAGTNGTVSTESLAIGVGTAKFAKDTLQIADLVNVTIAEGGVLDLTAYTGEGITSPMLAMEKDGVTGEGTVRIGNGWMVFWDLSLLTENKLNYDVNIEAAGGFEILRRAGEASSDNNVLLEIDKKLTITGDNAEFKIGRGTDVTVMKDGQIVVPGTIKLANAEVGVDTGSTLTLCEGGSIKAKNIERVKAYDSYFTMTGGTLELTGTGGIDSNISTSISGGELVANTADWGITGGSVGGVKVIGSNTITLTDATLTSTIDNSAGKLGLAGTIDITSEGYVTTTTPSEYSEAGNEGYVRVNTNYVVANTAADTNLTIAEGTTWTVDGSDANVSYANGVVTVAGTDWSTDYYVLTEKTLSTGISKTNGEGEALETIVLAGGSLNLDEALGEGVTIRIEKEGQSVVNIGDGLTLAAGQVTGTDASHVLKLHGNGTYALADGTATLGNAVLGDWTGTVKVTNAYQNDGKMDIDAKLNPLADADSTVEVTNVKGYLDTGKALTANVRLVNATDGTAAITITNGNSDGTIGARKAVIQGTVSGSGDIAFATWDGINGKYVTYEFSGEISGWNGSFINKSPQSYSGTANVVIAGDTEINASFLNAEGRYAGSKLYLTIAGDSAVTMNGAVDVDKLTVSQNTSFTNTVAVADLVNTASASFVNNLALATLDNTGSITATGKDITVAGAVTGTGSIAAQNLTLQGAANTMGDLTLSGALTLDSGVTSLTAGKLNIAGGVTLNTVAEGLISATTVENGLTLNIAEALLDSTLAITESKKVTLLTLTGEMDEAAIKAVLDTVLLGAFTEDGEAGVTQAGTLYDYTLVQEGNSLILQAAISSMGYVWTGESYEWSAGDSWEAGFVPDETSTVFLVGGERTNVHIGEGVEAKAANIIMEDWEAKQPGSIGGLGSLAVTDDIKLNNGQLNLLVDTTVGGDIIVNGQSKLTVGAFEGTDITVGVTGNLENNSEVYVDAGGTLDITGAVTNAGELVNIGGTLTAGSLSNTSTLVSVDGTTEVTGELANTGSTMVLGGTLTAGSMANDGSVAVSAGELAVTGTLTNNDTITVTGGVVDVTGTLANADSLTVSGGSLSAGSVDNDGSIAITGGSVSAGALANDGGSLSVTGEGTTVVIGTADATTTVTNNGGSITVDSGASLTVNGNVDNTGGTITVGTDAESTADLTITGNLTGTGGTDKLVVNSGSSLEVGGDLTALEDVELDFDGTVIVRGNVDIDSLVNNGVFKTTNMAEDAKVEIGALSGSGELNIAGGKLLIGSQVDFTGILTGDGELEITGDNGFTLLTKQDEITDTALATDVTASEVTITEAANGSILGDVTTDSIVLDKLDTELGTSHLTVGSLAAKTEGGVLDIEISDLAVDTLIANRGEQYDLVTMGGTAPALNLVNNDDVTSDDMQALLLNGLNIELSPAEAGEEVATFAMTRNAGTTVQLVVRELTDEEATWTVGDTTTGAGLIVLDNGVLKGASYLDYVRTVEVAAATELDLTAVDTAADSLVKLNGLTGAEGADLTVKGEGDYVSINNLELDTEDTTDRTEYKGTLKLAGVTAGLDLADMKVSVEDATVVLTGSMVDGSLTIDAAKGIGAASDLDIDGTDLVINNYTASADMTEVSMTDHVLVDLGAVTGSEGELTINGTEKDLALLDKYFTNVRFSADAGAVVADRNTSYYTDKLTDSSTSKNGAAGMELADAALLYVNPQMNQNSDLGKVLDQLDALVASGNTAAADELGASLAGASTAVLGMAAMGDVERQLRAIRNRTTTMGVDQSVANDDMPYFNAWINAEGDMSELNSDGTAGGYKLNSWGGTVGFDVDFCPTLTAGMAMTAMYGDLDATGADTASGNMDSYYLSVFARYAPSAWTHTFVATVGTSDISLDRTVAGTQLQGETSGMSFGLMYEVGHVIALDEDATACLQPVFNVTWKHSTVDGYTEKGGDLALEVGEQTMDTVTFGLGARLQAIVGESMYNRTSILEARVLAKLDAGDRKGSSDVALTAVPGVQSSVESAEMGAFGIELGAGLTIPVGQDGGSIFMDASVELRGDYTNANGTVGYRINF